MDPSQIEGILRQFESLAETRVMEKRKFEIYISSAAAHC
jgi:hypothetical protein